MPRSFKSINDLEKPKATTNGNKSLSSMTNYLSFNKKSTKCIPLIMTITISNNSSNLWHKQGKINKSKN